MPEQVTIADMKEREAFPLPDRVPDNEFFDDGSGHYRGRSWSVEIEGFPATSGVVEAGTGYRYRIDSPEIVLVHAGTVTYEEEVSGFNRPLSPLYSPFVGGFAFDLPVNKEFNLRVPTKEEQAQDKVAGEPSDLIYTCFYPKNREEFRGLLRLIARELHHHYVGHEYYFDGSESDPLQKN